MSGLYPRLEEPWSDVDDEGAVLGEDDPGTSLFYGQGGVGETETGPSNLQHRSHSPRDSTDGVSLSEFEDHFLGRSGRSGSYDPPVLQRLHRKWQERNSPLLYHSAAGNVSSSSIFGDNMRGQTSVSVSSVSIWVWDVGGRIVEWTLAASLWKKAVMTVLLAVLCSMIVTALRTQLDTHKLAQYICGTKDVPSLTMTLGELKKLHELKDVSKEDMENVFYLILVNPHWNIRWMDSINKTVTDWTRSPQSSDTLASSSPSLSIRCRLLLKLASLWSLVQWIILFVLGVVVVYAVFALYQKKKRKRESAIFSLVGRIMDVMKYHYKKTHTKKDLLPYLAIIHVRDMLVPPSERKAKEELWNEAVQWIASHESRVRVETRRIAGQDFQVWRWIQEDPPPTEIPSSQPSSQSSPAGGQKGRSQGNWTGSVFDHYPPEITTKVAPPTGTPSVCIRLKNMFEPIRKMNETQIRELENSVLERCRPHGSVVHVWVDKRSPVGCVYLKMDTLKSAMDSYNVLHGGWYKGKLVTAKYIPEIKYHKWFPAAVNAITPILET